MQHPDNEAPSRHETEITSEAVAADTAKDVLPKSNPKSLSGNLNDQEHPRGARTTLRVMFAGLLLLVTWAALGKLDQVTRAQAQVVAEARTQVIQSPDGGVLTELHVKEGDKVKAGQVLATLQKERAEAAVSETKAKVAALRITLVRLQAEVYGRPLTFDNDLKAYPEYISNQTDLYKKRQQAFREDIDALTKILELSDSELKINLKLEASGDVSRTEVLRLERSVADVRAQLASKKNKYFQDAQAEMTKAQEDLSTQSELLRDRNQLLEHTVLTAPVDGVVNNIRINTLGGVVRQGESVMELLPWSEELIIEAKVTPVDIAFVLVGQDANIKVDAYDSSIFGSLQGKVTYISSDVLSEDTRQGPFLYYRVRIRPEAGHLQTDKGSRIQLKPGMSASVDIKANERSVLSYLVKPLSKAFSQSMGER
ncbi:MULTISPECIES: HlyD family efflux transporter periplasmic adaptor subunit [unclassified Limnohabitans]|uniref:HlyD family efflux transporter periplasmic adaptor subunit n=1 Tax=unclassified Limnohabitans TaxID=2626134 RepID=UPI0018EC57AB|nr:MULTISPECIES: HlyD family efflux transporter periplasmic adaptor subunit [unclassified Limnohabitans]